ncbi:MAG: AMIN domain-containing protein [Alphaproteobacteria bacterium]|nr:AMIN domain-containing protein [Alphaproteobacteria bacterium]
MIRIFTTIALTLLLTALSTAYAWALSVDAVRVGVHPDKTRMVLELSEVSDFRVFVLDDPTRIVVDLPAFTWTAGAMQNAPRFPDPGGTPRRAATRCLADRF